MKSLSKLLVPNNISIDDMWYTLQVKKEKVSECRILTQSADIEQHLIILSALHHNRSAQAPALHTYYGIDHEPNRAAPDEKEYQEWITELKDCKK